MALSKFAFFMIFVIAVGLYQNVQALPYKVGGALGWIIPPSADYYDEWSAGQTFKIGDTLVFTFDSGMHDVMEVMPADVASCNTSNPIFRNTTSNAIIPLRRNGTHAYLCSIGTHCSSGMKMTVKVEGIESDDSLLSDTAPPTRTSAAPSASKPAGFNTRQFLATVITGVMLTARLL